MHTHTGAPAPEVLTTGPKGGNAGRCTHSTTSSPSSLLACSWPFKSKLEWPCCLPLRRSGQEKIAAPRDPSVTKTCCVPAGG
eukprot:698880-Pelagomonas_calceolata.AAC.2